MALIACHECGRQVSTEAPACPQCGAPRRQAPTPQAASAFPPPAIHASPTLPGFSDSVREELTKLTKVGAWRIVAWVGFGFFVPAAIFGRNPVGLLIGFVCGVISFRAWCARRTVRIILKRPSLERYASRVYFPALWSYAWRSCVIFVPLAFLLAFATSETAYERGRAIGAVIGMWLFPSLFVLDVPFWIRRKVQGIIRKMASDMSLTATAS